MLWTSSFSVGPSDVKFIEDVLYLLSSCGMHRLLRVFAGHLSILYPFFFLPNQLPLPVHF